MGKVFKVGEQKEVGVEISSTDGTNFSVTATYKYLDKNHNELASGTAEVDGKKVFVLLTPSQAGSNQQVVFTCTLTPLGEDGQPDPSKNSEVIMPSVLITVTQY